MRRVLRIFYQDRLVDLAYNVGGRPENRNLVDVVFAQAEEGLFGQSVGSIRIAGIESSVAPVMAGFDSTGHPQAKGVEVKLVYPESWQLSLKGTENTVLFVSMHRGAVTEKLNLAVYAAPPDQTKPLFDIKGSPAKKVRQQKWQKMLESPGKRISLIEDATVDGLPAVLMEKVPVEGGKATQGVTKSREMFIYHPKGLVAVTCAVTADNGNRKELEKAFSVMEKGVCRPVFDSLVFADKPPPEASGAAQPNAEAMALFDTAGHPVAGMAHLQVRYPKSWQSHSPHEKDGLLELTRRQDNVLEMLELKMADLSQEDAASIFGMESGLSQKTRLEIARKYMKDMRDIRVVSLKDVTVDGQPATVWDFEKVHATGKVTLFIRARVLMVYYGEKLVFLNYMVGSKPENRAAVLKQFALGERSIVPACFGSLRFLNKAEMAKQVKEKRRKAPVVSDAFSLVDATGNPQAKNARIRLLMPAGWESNPSPAQDTVEERASPDGLLVKGIALNVYKMDDAANRSIFALKGALPEKERRAHLRKLYQPGLTLLGFYAQDTVFKGRPAVLSDLAVSRSTGGMQMYMKSRVLEVYDGERRITVLCSTVGPEEMKKDVDALQVENLGKNCNPMFDSLEFIK